MDPAARARPSPAKSAARVGTSPRRSRLIILFAGLGSLLLLAWGGLTLHRAKSAQSRQDADGVRVAQRRAGELSTRVNVPHAPPRSPQSTLPATPTPLPMPGLQHNTDAKTPSGPRYLVHDSVPPRPMAGHLFVDTQPQSSVWIDGEAKGKTPLDVTVGPGSKQLRLEAPGFRPVRETFEAGQGALIRRALVPVDPPR